ncbi:hypothetical protein CWI38_0684p0020 [Hamiltosporidium tvaerminnensis]|uniref:Uncharacterized protein n=1 Tax=Hamiltosporidium tvaerminnensis TaxID=1176355 RepID=A0A4V2JXP7_9MICR|nr:hypothetical protein CWI37_0950p0020 [Hamiltosporidium tvaerminnensis]TBU12642.1 hypothetical protein CWI38_0684p0020 [Hamiltosporidium tvaerminnensis]
MFFKKKLSLKDNLTLFYLKCKYRIKDLKKSLFKEQLNIKRNKIDYVRYSENENDESYVNLHIKKKKHFFGLKRIRMIILENKNNLEWFNSDESLIRNSMVFLKNASEYIDDSYYEFIEILNNTNPKFDIKYVDQELMNIMSDTTDDMAVSYLNILQNMSEDKEENDILALKIRLDACIESNL